MEETDCSCSDAEMGQRWSVFRSQSARLASKVDLDSVIELFICQSHGMQSSSFVRCVV